MAEIGNIATLPYGETPTKNLQNIAQYLIINSDYCLFFPLETLIIASMCFFIDMY